MQQKRGVFFSTDALIALGIILIIMVVAFPLTQKSIKKTELHYDILETFSFLKMGETTDVPPHLITNPNQSVLEQIGELYITDIGPAKELAEIMLVNLETNENIGIWYGNRHIASINSTSYEDAENIDTARQIISGIREGESVTGFSARASLSNGLQTKYFYFGGYVGDGNISILVDYNGNISSAEIEIATNEDFDLYVEGNHLDNFQGSISEFTPVNYNISTQFFQSGENLLELKGNNLHVAGGFIKITYESDIQYEQPTKYNFPGLEGLINLYDGFFIPGNLNSLEIFLHLNTTLSNAFLNIGNTTVFNSTTNGEESFTITNPELLTLLPEYQTLSDKTIPLRLGLENVSFATNVSGNADAFSVTDLSGSMCGQCTGGGGFCCFFSGGCNNNQPSCEFCGGTCEPAIQNAKEANEVFVDALLNSSENRVGLVGYKENVHNSDFHELSDNDISLKNKINEWEAQGATCICCGINRATEELVSNSPPGKLKTMVVLSDGQANRQCPEQGTGNPLQDAIQASCEAFNNNVTVHAVGFGEDADETTLQAIAACGNGSYFYSDIEGIASIYQQIADTIIATYTEQTIQITGDFFTQLYPDSYIEFDYDPTPTPFGLLITTEQQFLNETTGNFSIPQDSTIVETRTTSYSGPRWTDRVEIKNDLVYKLSSYGDDYIVLGDPYNINIPNSLVNTSTSNLVTLTTGVSPDNSTEGSSSNKIIYTIAREAVSFSPISGSAEGCIWHIQFEDNTNLIANIPDTYMGIEECYYEEGNVQEPDPGRDAFQTAIFNLLEELDLNSNGKVDISFTEQDLQIELTEIVGIPFTWSTEVQVRTWF